MNNERNQVKEVATSSQQLVQEMLTKAKTYKVSNTTGLYIQILEELEDVAEKLIAVWEYEAGASITDEEWDKLTESVSHVRSYVEKRLQKSIEDRLTNREISEI